MSFLLPCPQCGPRDVYEFRYGGEAQRRPSPGSPRTTWTGYLYDKTNAAGIEDAWWYHRLGCKRWFRAVRDTRDNRVIKSTAPTVPARDADDPATD